MSNHSTTDIEVEAPNKRFGWVKKFSAASIYSALAVSPAFAQDGPFGSLTNFLEALVDTLTNGWAQLIAVIAIFITGVLWMTGNINMRWLLSVVGGIILIFGAAEIVDGITGSI